MATVSLDLPLQLQNVCDSTGPLLNRFYTSGIADNVFSNGLGSGFLKGLGRMFYMVDPKDTTFKSVDAVPSYFIQAWPYFLLFILLENILLWIEKRPTNRLNDEITSVSHGILQECGRLLLRGGESYIYVYIYEHYRIFDLKWDSSWTWYLAAISIDFFYYWMHRACHETHILWSQHQVHHSSEDFNMAVGLRQSIFQGFALIFYTPLALIIPPAHFAAHQQFNLLYQFWIHTEAVRNLGPLEWVLNTPNHHRVHHGSNLYLLDKNYGGVLIIWDRIFGTFEKEDKSQPLIYGILSNQPSFNILHLQTFYTGYMIEKFKSMSGWKHKLAAIFYGPSWEPGSPRLGNEADKPIAVVKEKHNVKISAWCKTYLTVHFSLVVYGFLELSSSYMSLSPLSAFVSIIYIIASVAIFGLFFDKNPYACVFELVRCMLLVTFIQRTTVPYINASLLLSAEVFYLLSGIFWCYQSFKVLEIMVKTKKE